MEESNKIDGRDPIRRLSGRYLKWAAYGALIVLACLLQGAPRLIPEVLGGRPLLIIPTVVFIAMFTGPYGGAAAGIAGGLLWDLYADRLFGFNALILMAMCCTAGLLTRMLLRNNLLSALLLSSAALLLQGLLDWYFNYVLLGGGEPLYHLLRLTLPNFVYTLLLSPLLYGAVRLTARLLRKKE
ncbi:MAG: rod shape-determining protein MreD [Clostridiales bacterium]|nr:rod shape-determining protein MreD [Clostridiales bacterium]